MTRGRSAFGRRSTARLAAVQALYQMDMSDATVDEALRDQTQGASDPDTGEPLRHGLDEAFLADLVHGTSARRDEIDRILAASLSGSWTLERLEVVLRAILRVGTYELLGRPDIDAPVTISEYVEIAKAFFEGGEPKLVNGVLDRLAATLRPRAARTAAESGDDDEDR